MKKSLWKTALRALPCLLLGGAAIATGACGSVDVPSDTPACLDDIIDKQQQSAVTEFEYKGKLVYYQAIAGCCDQASTLFDDKCAVICSPDGGFSGGGDGKCADFFQVATKKRVIWAGEAQ